MLSLLGSERTCRFAKSWGDAPYGHNAAHYYAECSSQGTCDRKTGECQCFDGYEGDACRRLKCPNDSIINTIEYLEKNDLGKKKN